MQQSGHHMAGISLIPSHNTGSKLIIPLAHRHPATMLSWYLCQTMSNVRQTTQK